MWQEVAEGAGSSSNDLCQFLIPLLITTLPPFSPQISQLKRCLSSELRGFQPLNLYCPAGYGGSLFGAVLVAGDIEMGF